MAPAGSRKRVKPNDSGGDAAEGASRVPLPPTPQASTDLKDHPEESSRRENTPSWYNKTWPRKAAPVAEVARESISAASNAAVDFVSKATSRPPSIRSPSIQLTRSRMGRSSTSGPADATTTKLNVTSDVVSPKPKATNTLENPKEQEPVPETSVIDKTVDTSKKLVENGEIKGSAEVEPSVEVSDQPGQKPEDNANTNTKWLGWFSKSEPTAEKVDTEGSASIRPQQDPAERPQTRPPSDVKPAQPLPSATSQEPTVPKPSEPKPSPNIAAALQPPLEAASDSRRRSWLQMWGGTPSEKAGSDAKAPLQEQTTENPSNTPAVESAKPPPPESDDSSAVVETTAPPSLRGDGGKSSGWIFWSRDKQNKSDDPHVGEIAISDTPSQNRPKRASISSAGPKEALKDLPQASKNPAKTKESQSNRKQEPSKAKNDQKPSAESRPETPVVKDSKAQAKDLSAKTTTPGKLKPTEREPSSLQEASKQLQKTVPNQVLPTFKDTFAPQENPSLLEQLGRFFNYSKLPETKHVSKVRDPPRIKSAVAIGVHGYFPAPLIRSVLGQPTGTSIKFADMAARAIRKWTEDQGYECNIKTAALEGEGRIAERVELLWKLLLNWIDEIRNADFVFIACHSQGVPVTMMLVAKLISFGCVSAARVGICAMAGVNMGPFQDYKSRWISGSAAELFDFSDPQSMVSQDYQAALEEALKFGVRILYIGSIDDQLVSMESSTFSPVSHPYIFRAVFVDGRVHPSNFLTSLVGFALKLRNLGVADHGLIRELSLPLAGSLVGGEGHSRIYEEDDVFTLAVEYALETTSINETALQNQRTTGVSTLQNPYILPFAMRGLLEEEYVKTELHEEASRLLTLFDEWKPTSKVLKDVKFRLEGIRSKL